LSQERTIQTINSMGIINKKMGLLNAKEPCKVEEEEMKEYESQKIERFIR